jgi:phosphonate degradation associated HDIG domain protein
VPARELSDIGELDMPNDAIEKLIDLYTDKGAAQYGREAVSQTEHALQSATLAEEEGASDALIAAALLHDVGHLIAKQADDDDTNDLHERIGWGFLKTNFGPEVSEPVRLHVEAKRYLCAVDSSYFAILSPASVHSLELQGGWHSPSEALDFEKVEFYGDAVSLRRWDDRAKIPNLKTRALTDYTNLLRGLCR